MKWKIGENMDRILRNVFGTLFSWSPLTSEALCGQRLLGFWTVSFKGNG